MNTILLRAAGLIWAVTSGACTVERAAAVVPGGVDGMVRRPPIAEVVPSSGDTSEAVAVVEPVPPAAAAPALVGGPAVTHVSSLSAVARDDRARAPTASAGSKAPRRLAQPSKAPPALLPLPGGQVRNAREYFATLPRRFQPDATRGLHAVFQFDLSGPDALAYTVTVDEATMKVARGHDDQANVFVEASAADYVKVINGELSGTRAIFSRRLRVGGSLTLARRMLKIFPPGHRVEPGTVEMAAKQ